MLVLCSIFCCALLTSCDSEDDFGNISSGLLSVSPDILLFPSIPSGQRAEQILTVRNVGSAAITLINIRINRPESPFKISLADGAEGTESTHLRTQRD